MDDMLHPVYFHLLWVLFRQKATWILILIAVLKVSLWNSGKLGVSVTAGTSGSSWDFLETWHHFFKTISRWLCKVVTRAGCLKRMTHLCLKNVEGRFCVMQMSCVQKCHAQTGRMRCCSLRTTRECSSLTEKWGPPPPTYQSGNPDCRICAAVNLRVYFLVHILPAQSVCASVNPTSDQLCRSSLASCSASLPSPNSTL